MANLISPQNVQVVTKDGEIVVSLKLDLNINLNGGQISVPIDEKVKAQSVHKSDEEAEWLIPDFVSSKKINFEK